MQTKTKPEDWLSEERWLDLLAPALDKDPDRADRVAKLFHYLLVEIESGPKGSTRAIQSLESAFRLTFSFTKTYRACLILFMASLGEDFPPDLGSIELLMEAMSRLEAEMKRINKRSVKTR